MVQHDVVVIVMGFVENLVIDFYEKVYNVVNGILEVEINEVVVIGVMVVEEVLNHEVMVVIFNLVNEDLEKNY